MLPVCHWMTLLFELHAFLWFRSHCDGWHSVNLPQRPKINGDTRSSCQAGPDQGMKKVMLRLTKPPARNLRGIRHVEKLEPNQDSQHMAAECKYPASAKTSWPPSLWSNRLWKDAAECLGIMLVLCDKAGCFYYKPTIVKQRVKNNSSISCLHLFSTLRINSCHSEHSEKASNDSHDACYLIVFLCFIVPEWLVCLSLTRSFFFEQEITTDF